MAIRMTFSTPTATMNQAALAFIEANGTRLAFVVADQAATRVFYEDLLGLPLTHFIREDNYAGTSGERVACAGVGVWVCGCVGVSVCRCVGRYVATLCRDVAMSLCRYVAMSLCRCVAVIGQNNDNLMWRGITPSR
jgi:hypothetical protein